MPNTVCEHLEVVYLRMVYLMDYDKIRTTSTRVEQYMRAALAAGKFWMNFMQYNKSIENSKGFDNQISQNSLKDIAKYENRFNQQMQNSLPIKV